MLSLSELEIWVKTSFCILQQSYLTYRNFTKTLGLLNLYTFWKYTLHLMNMLSRLTRAVYKKMKMCRISARSSGDALSAVRRLGPQRGFSGAQTQSRRRQRWSKLMRTLQIYSSFKIINFSALHPPILIIFFLNRYSNSRWTRISTFKS